MNHALPPISRVAIGGLTFGDALDGDDAARVIHEALERGVNLIDTAESYADGRSEGVIGEALAGGRRDRVLLATKVYNRVTADAGSGRLSGANVVASLEGSLRRLGTDRVDLLQLHHPDPQTHWEETFAALDGLIRAGKVRFVGVCNHYAWQIAHLAGELRRSGLPGFLTSQHVYNVLDRQIEAETAVCCCRLGVSVLAYEPFCQGILAGTYGPNRPAPTGIRANDRVRGYLATSRVQSILAELRSLARELGLAMSQLAVLWLLAKPHVASAILGGDRPEHFRSVYDALDLELPADAVARIDALSASRVHLPFPNQPVTDVPAWFAPAGAAPVPPPQPGS